MSSSKKYAIFILILLACCVGYERCGNKSHSPPANKVAGAYEGKSSKEEKLLRKSPRVREDSSADTERMTHLRTLKKKWSRLSTDASEEEVDALSIESVSLLLCSKEAIQLVEFLEKSRIYNKVSSKIEIWLASGSHPEMRALIVELPDTPSASNYNFRESWSDEAGEGCPESEIEEFCKSLTSPRCAQEALFGFNSRLSATDPERALRSTLIQLQAGIKTSSVGSCIRDQMDKLPADVNFESLEKLLPQSPEEDKMSPVNQGRGLLFNKWAKVDPAAAANYVISDLHRFSPELMKPIAQAVSLKDPWICVEWVQHIPEGPHFDQAAYAALNSIRLSYPTEAIQLAELISDPKLRERAIKKVKDNLR